MLATGGGDRKDKHSDKHRGIYGSSNFSMAFSWILYKHLDLLLGANCVAFIWRKETNRLNCDFTMVGSPQAMFVGRLVGKRPCQRGGRGRKGVLLQGFLHHSKPDFSMLWGGRYIACMCRI